MPDASPQPRLDELVAVLQDQARLGILGTTADDAIRQSERFLEALPDEGRVLDLGSGAGVPGLALAVRRPALSLVLLDVRQRRTDQLARAVSRLNLGDRVRVVCADARQASTWPDLAGTFDAVVARSFGPPSRLLPIARPFLRAGGRLVVSEPPDAARGWPPALLEELGLIRTYATPGLFVAEVR